LYVGVFGDYVFGKALFVKVKVRTGIQEFGSSIIIYTLNEMLFGWSGKGG